jgi:hypothetical protein
MYDFKRYGINV